MTDRINRVLAIPGSLRWKSYNRTLARTAVSLSPEGMSVAVYDSLGTVPVFNEDMEHSPPKGVVELRDAVAGSDGLLIVTPEYNQSVPGVVKNMIDWLSRTETPGGLGGKPVAVTGVTTGPWGTRLSQTQLRQILTSTQSLVLPEPTLFLRDAETLFDETGNLNDQTTLHRLRELLAAFDSWIRQVTSERSADSAVSHDRESDDGG